MLLVVQESVEVHGGFDGRERMAKGGRGISTRVTDGYVLWDLPGGD